MVNRVITAVYVDDLQVSRRFYMDLLDLKPVFEADWIVQLSDPDNEHIHLTLQPRNHHLIPETFRQPPQGFSLVFVVDDCDTVYQRAESLGFRIVQPPVNEEYGQRRFLVADPDGTLVDVSSLCEPSPEFVKKYFN